jgi:hypothetical protein
MTIEEELKKMGLWDRYQDIQQKTPEEKEALIAAGTPKPDKASNETSADELKNIGDFRLTDPNVSQPDMSTASGRLGYWQQKYQTEIQESQNKQKEYDERISKFEEEQKKWWKSLTEKQTLEDKSKEVWEELGIKPSEYFAERKADIGEMGGLMNEYDKKVAERDAAIAHITGRPGTTIEFAGGEAQRITNQYNVELNRMATNINTRAAVMEARQGNFQEARSFVNEAIQNYTYDLKLTYEQYDMFREENMDILNDLGEDIKGSLDKAESIAYNMWQDTVEDKEKVMDLKLNNPQADIEIDDTYEEAVEKLSEWQKAQPAAGEGLWTQTSGGFEILRDSAGNIINTRVAGTGEGAGRVWSLDEIRADLRIDIRSLKENNPEVSDQYLYESLYDAIQVNPDITNKQDAINILRELLNVSPEGIPPTTEEPTKEKFTSAGEGKLWTPEGTIIPEEDKSKYIKETSTGVNVYGGSITGTDTEGGYWSGLFAPGWMPSWLAEEELTASKGEIKK